MELLVVLEDLEAASDDLVHAASTDPVHFVLLLLFLLVLGGLLDGYISDFDAVVIILIAAGVVLTLFLNDLLQNLHLLLIFLLRLLAIYQRWSLIRCLLRCLLRCLVRTLPILILTACLSL